MSLTVPLPVKNRSSLNASWKEGIASNIMIAITDYYFIPLALFMGASAQQIGLLVAVPHLFGSLCQVFASQLIRTMGGRVKFLVRGAICQTVILVPIAMLPILHLPGRVQTLIIGVVLFRVVGNLLGTIWGSLISSYLNPEERGSYLGWRQRIASISGIVGLAVGGVLLSSLESFSEATAFACIFLLTAAARFISARFMSRMEDVDVEFSGTDAEFTFLDFVKQFRESNFVKFVIYVACITFSTQIASPYFNVHMLENLNFSYLQYMSMHMASALAGLLTFPIWGRHADKVGNAQVLKLTSFVIPIIPILWIFTRSYPLLLCVELLAGFIWGGFNLCSLNFIYDAVSPAKRVRCLSYFSLINGLCIFLGATLGGYLVGYLPHVAGYRLLSLFLLSGLLRFASHFILSGQFKEVRELVHPTTSQKLFFSVLGIRPLIGRNRI
jgi:MFS family permease